MNPVMSFFARSRRAADQAQRREIIIAHPPCETAENGTGARCTCLFDCANYWLRAKGHKREGGQSAATESIPGGAA